MIVLRFVVLAVLLVSLMPAAGRAELITGLTTSNSLVFFDSASPGTVSGPLAISGFVDGSEEAVGIDYRPSTPGVLVAVTRQSVGRTTAVGTGRVYTIDTTTGVATLINTLTALLTAPGAFDYGIDFNPMANALRIVSNSDQNLRIAGGGAGATNVDTPLNPSGQFVDSIAYTNNFAGATSTTLYGIAVGPEPDELVTIAPPNAGTLTVVGLVLPFNPAFLGNNGFDISGATGIAYAAFRPTLSGPDSLYTIDVGVHQGAGTTTLLGAIGVQPGTLRDISVVQAVPEPASLTLFGVGLAGLLGYRRRRRSSPA